jgi:hypothetical protein
MNKLINRIKCFFGYHDWKNISTSGYPFVPENGFVDVSELHECTKCHKKAFLGMGRFY